jgi:broad specificity phosphatase PhoE
MRLARILTLALAALALSASAVAAQAPTVVILTRHAEKASDGGNDPDLSRAGRARARALVRALAHERIDAVITTQYRRTRETAAPLAEARHLTPEVADVHAGDYVRRIAELVRIRHTGQAVLVVAHAESIARIVAALGGPPMNEMCDWQYGDLYTLVLRTGRAASLAHSRYGAPDHPGHGCR